MVSNIPFGSYQPEWADYLKMYSSGAFHLLKISGISGSAVNGTRFVGSSHWKTPRKSGKSKKVVPFSRLEFPNGISCSIYVSRSLYQFQVHGRAPSRTGVYDQMEQLFTTRKFHFCYHRNFRVFFLNGKRPSFSVGISEKWPYHLTFIRNFGNFLSNGKHPWGRGCVSSASLSSWRKWQKLPHVLRRRNNRNTA